MPGLAKTLIVKTLSEVLDLNFSRIQFTPDLMPSDITGTEILENDKDGKKIFKFIKGPIFANIILADEINRTPPKTQSALLEAMQEHQCYSCRSKYILWKNHFLFWQLKILLSRKERIRCRKHSSTGLCLICGSIIRSLMKSLT